MTKAETIPALQLAFVIFFAAVSIGLLIEEPLMNDKVVAAAQFVTSSPRKPNCTSIAISKQKCLAPSY